MTQYDYAFIVKSFDISDVGNIAAPEGNIKLTEKLANLAIAVGQTLPQLDGGGFEIVSHDTTMTYFTKIRQSIETLL